MASITAPSRRLYHPLQRDAATFLETSEESGGTRISGPVRVVQPLFGLLARRARAKGIDREHAQRYVTL
jgi:hypothetical protein